MEGKQGVDSPQGRLWNGPKGLVWVELQSLLDQVFKPLEDLLMEGVQAGMPDRLLDVGCGTGSTTLAAARILGGRRRCIGIDISEPMIAAAQSRARRQHSSAAFVCADAQRHVFDPAGFDAIISRIGVMFFENPPGAFANLRRAARANATLSFVAWRSPAENPFMTAAERATAALLPDLPPRRPGAPGQFAFAEEAHIRKVLAPGGWDRVEVHSVDLPCRLPEKDLILLITRMGPLGDLLQEADIDDRARVIETARAAFDSYVRGTEVHFTSACWLVTAHASAGSVSAVGGRDA